MRIVVAAVGRLKAGAEADLAERYVGRAVALGRGLGLAVEIREVVEGREARTEDRLASEAAALAALIPSGAALIALDERGRTLASRALAARIGTWRDEGRRDLAFAIGGPDGLAEPLRARADLVLALGAMTWPHQLVRVMLAEQIYRCCTILAGHPYHRD